MYRTSLLVGPTVERLTTMLDSGQTDLPYLTILKMLFSIPGDVNIFSLVEAMANTSMEKDIFLKTCYDDDKLGSIWKFDSPGRRLSVYVEKHVNLQDITRKYFLLHICGVKNESIQIHADTDGIMLASEHKEHYEITQPDGQTSTDSPKPISDHSSDVEEEGSSTGTESSGTTENANGSQSGVVSSAEESGVPEQREGSSETQTGEIDFHNQDLANSIFNFLFGTAYPSFMHVTNFLKDYHEKAQTKSYVMTHGSIPTETTIVYDNITVAIVKMMDGKFYRVLGAVTDVGLSDPSWIATNDGDRWSRIGKDIQDRSNKNNFQQPWRPSRYR